MDKQKLLQEIDTLWQQQNWLQMEKICTQGLRYFPNSASTYYKRAIAKFKLELFKEAREDLEQALKIRPGQEEIKVLLDKMQAFIKAFKNSIPTELNHSLLFEEGRGGLAKAFAEEISEMPKKISRYEIVQELGRGGMGVVYKAFDPHMNKSVALKVILGGNKQRQIVEKFFQEAKTMAKFSHANIVRVYDVTNNNSNPFICMDYIEGQSLKEYLQKAYPDTRLLCKLMIKIGTAVAYAHEKKIIHRDLKPANIMLDKNLEPFVMDFGLAKLIKTDASLSKKAIVGTPQYMSPQQARGEGVNEATDLYALGAIFYEMLASKPMVEGATIAEIIFRVINKKPKPLREINNKLAKDLETICAKAVEKDIAKRYKSAKEFIEDIDRFLRGELISARNYSIWQRNYKKLKAHSYSILAGFIGFAILLTSVWSFEKKQIQIHISKAEKLEQKITEKDPIDRQIAILIKAKNHLEKISKRSIVKEKLFDLQKKMGALATKQKNYLLAYTFFKQCKKLEKNAGEKLLIKLEQEKNKQKEKDKKLMHKAMQAMLQGEPDKALMDSYVFKIVKMQKEYVVEFLVPYLKSENKWQRFLAIQTLGRLGNSFTKFKGKDSVEWLLERLAIFNKETIQENQKEVEEIIWSLGWLRDSRANELVFKTRIFSRENNMLWRKTRVPYKLIPLEKNRKIETAEQFRIRGAMKTEKENYKSAIIDYNQAIKLNPKDTKVYNDRGNVYHIIKKYQKAIIDFNKAIELNPKSSGAYNNRAVVYKELKEYTKAIVDYSQAIKLNPKYLEVYNNRALIYRELKEYKKAIIDCNKVIQLNSKNAKAYNTRAGVHRELKEYKKAIIDYNKAIQLNSKNAEIYYNRAIVYQITKKYAEAMADYNKAINLRPKYLKAYYNRAGVYFFVKEYAKAIVDYSQAIKFNPRHSGAYSNRAHTYRMWGKYAKAIADYNKVLGLNPKNSRVYYNRAVVYHTTKKYAKALADYNKAIALGSRHIDAYRNRGFLYQTLKKYQKAYQDFQTFLKLAPNHPMSSKVRAILNIKKGKVIK